MITELETAITKEISFFQPLLEIKMSPIVKIAEMARQLEPEFEAKHGSKFIHLERGEIDLQTPKEIVAAINQKFWEGKTKYPKSGGEIDLKKRIAEKLIHQNHIPNINHEDIVVTVGGQEALNLSFQLFANKVGAGFSPIWSVAIENFFPYSNISFLEVPLNTDFSINYQALEEVFGQIDFFYLNNPQNPSGKVFSKEEIKKVVALCQNHNVFLISDEAYEHIIFDKKIFTSAASVAAEMGFENVISTYTYSKSFAATGLRVGYAVSKNKKAIALIAAAQYTHAAGVPTAVQLGLIDAYDLDLSAIVNEFQERRDALYNGLKKIDSITVNKPEGAFYIYPDFSAALKKKGMAPHQLLDTLLSIGIVIVQGAAFTKQGYFETHARLSFSAVNVEQIDVAIERLSKFFA